jgi:hypothetical protein
MINGLALDGSAGVPTRPAGPTGARPHGPHFGMPSAALRQLHSLPRSHARPFSPRRPQRITPSREVVRLGARIEACRPCERRRLMRRGGVHPRAHRRAGHSRRVQVAPAHPLLATHTPIQFINMPFDPDNKQQCNFDCYTQPPPRGSERAATGEAHTSEMPNLEAASRV